MYAYVDLPDPYPGRCGCLSFNPATGQNERCLGYADKPHICAWPKEKPATAYSIMTPDRDRVYPPWVSPLDKDEDV